MRILCKPFILLLAGFLALFIDIPAVFAESSSTGTSEATIHFIEGEAPPDILDPTDPKNPYDPDPTDPSDPDDEEIGNTGPLTLDYVSSVHFGKQEIAGRTRVYESTVLRPFIQVSDRRGTQAGWEVTAQVSEFTDQDGTSTLKGAKLTFKGGEVVSPNENLNAPTPSNKVELYAGGDGDDVVIAEQGEGVATWITRWFHSGESEKNDNVTLEIPGGSATTGTHKATITWTLTDAPI